MNKGKISMSLQWSTEKLKQWRGEIEREKELKRAPRPHGFESQILQTTIIHGRNLGL